MRVRDWLWASTLAVVSSATFAAEPASTAAEPAVNTSDVRESAPAAPASGPEPPAAPAPTRRGATDRLELDTTVVTGNRELPKVLYIVPWKKADLGDLPAQPFNTLLDEVLTPVDRDVFRREVTYYDAVQASPDATQSTSSSQQ